MNELILKKLEAGEVTIRGNVSGGKREVLSLGATTAETNLSVDQSGALMLLDGTASQIQVINLPTITSADIGTYYDFNVLAIGNSGAAGSYTINTGGHATDVTTGSSRTAGYDDFIGVLRVVDNVATTNADKSNIVPASGEGAFIIADDTTNGVLDLGSSFRCTAVSASTTTAGANVWLLEGRLFTAQATGFVTTNVFTAP